MRGDAGIYYTVPYGVVEEHDTFDWGGALLSRNVSRYSVDYCSSIPSYCSYMSANLLNQVFYQGVYDVSWNQCASTLYYYDQTTPIEYGTMEGHLSAPPSSVRGNLTSVSRWVSSAPCQPGATGTWIYSNQSVYDTGMVQQSSDFLGYSTTYVYSGTYYGAYPTTISNALGQPTYYLYDSNTGLPTKITDPNNQPTLYSYDIMLRPTQVNYPDGGETIFNYPSPTVVEELDNIDGSHFKDTYSYFDGMGRMITTHLVSDPQGDGFYGHNVRSARARRVCLEPPLRKRERDRWHDALLL